MDATTQQFYSAKASELATDYARAATAMKSRLLRTFHKSGRVLDVGCGTGRDLEILLSAGKDAIGVEPCDEMRVVAMSALTAAGIDATDRIISRSLPHLGCFEDQSFDGILCSAILMHLPEEEVFDAVFTLRRLLKPGSPLLISIPEERSDVDPATLRDAHGRLFTSLPHTKISLLFERVGFAVRETEIVPDSLGRPGVSWRVTEFRLDDTAEKPLHLVESILNRDKKDATYKLALFRALAEIAQTQHHLAAYLPNAKVGVPIASIAEKWLLYYWPIFASDRFIEQRTSEKAEGRGAVKIRKPLNALIEHYRPAGGLSGFFSDLRANRLSQSARVLHNRTLSNLKNTIWDMPVRHAGGGQFGVLDYDHNSKLVLMSDSLWRELCLTGSWIQDATVLRWAQLTERLSNGRTKASVVIDCLLSIPDPERNVNVAKGYFLNLPSPVCVWSDRSLSESRFDIDHAMPFTLWRNNDLWNLFPADKGINNQKRDRLPTYDLLQRRRDIIIGYWEGMACALGARFECEAQTLLGRDAFDANNWQSKLFARFVEAFEVTASQRGAERWNLEGGASKTGAVVKLPTAESANKYGEAQLEESQVLILQATGDGPAAARILSFDQVKDRAFKTHLPILGSLAAGDPFQGFETDSLGVVESVDWIEVPKRLIRPRCFVVRIAGDSMEPGLSVGDYAVFEYHRTPRREGQIVIALKPESYTGEPGSQTIKRIYQEGEDWVLRADNPIYPDIKIPAVETRQPIVGIFVEKVD